MGVGRCRLHGGASRIQHGLYSKVIWKYRETSPLWRRLRRREIGEELMAIFEVMGTYIPEEERGDLEERIEAKLEELREMNRS